MIVRGVSAHPCACIMERRWEGPSYWRMTSTDELVAVRDELLLKCPGEFTHLVRDLGAEVARRDQARTGVTA